MGWSLVVDAGVEPAPDALEQLQRARVTVPEAVVLAAKVVLPDGSLDPGSEPLPRILDKEAAIASARLGLLAVRAVRPGTLLVRDDARALLAARGPAAVLAASAAALADGGGHLVPAAVAVRTLPAPVEPLRARLALLRAPHWTREERLLQLFTLAQGAAGRRAGRAAR